MPLAPRLCLSFQTLTGLASSFPDESLFNDTLLPSGDAPCVDELRDCLSVFEGVEEWDGVVGGERSAGRLKRGLMLLARRGEAADAEEESRGEDVEREREVDDALGRIWARKEASKVDQLENGRRRKKARRRTFGEPLFVMGVPLSPPVRPTALPDNVAPATRPPLALSFLPAENAFQTSRVMTTVSPALSQSRLSPTVRRKKSR